MSTAAELLNRRIGRMEALASDLAVLKPRYQPTELEVQRAQELKSGLIKLLALAPPPEGAALAPAPEEAPAPEAKSKPSKK